MVSHKKKNTKRIMPADTSDLTGMYCTLTFADDRSTSQIWLSGLLPLTSETHELELRDIEILVGLLDESYLPDSFRRAAPSRVKHHHICVYPDNRFLMQIKTVWRTMYHAVDQSRNVLLYARNPGLLSTVWIGFLLYLYADNGFVRSPFPKTHRTWTLSYLKQLERVYPDAVVTIEHMDWLVRYERNALELYERPFATFTV